MPKSSSEQKEPKRSIFEFTSVKLKGVERELGRLNRNLELLLLHAFQVNVNEFKKGEVPDDDVTYSSDMDTLKDEFMKARRREEESEEIDYS